MLTIIIITTTTITTTSSTPTTTTTTTTTIVIILIVIYWIQSIANDYKPLFSSTASEAMLQRLEVENPELARQLKQDRGDRGDRGRVAGDWGEEKAMEKPWLNLGKMIY